MGQYHLYGKTILTNVSLPLQKSLKTTRPLRVDYIKSKDSLSQKNNLWSFDSNIILNKKNNKYIFWVSGKKSKAQLATVLSNVIVPHILSLTGEIIVHGSCVTMENKGIIFAGVSGVGKSTIAHLAQNMQHALVSDDKVLLKKKSNNINIFGGDHKIKLIKSKTSKKVVKRLMNAKSVRNKVKLSSIFILNKKGRKGPLKFTKLKGMNKFKKMLPHLLVLKESTKDSKSKVVSAAFDTFQAVNIWMVNYPHVSGNKNQLLSRIKRLTEKL